MDTATAVLTLILLAATGAVWLLIARAGSKASPSGTEGEFVEIFRCDMGQGYTDSDLLDMIGFLGSRGIPATYDAAYAGAELVTIKTYALKVRAEYADEARGVLREWFAPDSEAET